MHRRLLSTTGARPRRRPRRRPRSAAGYMGTIYPFGAPDHVGARDQDLWIGDVNEEIQRKRDEDPQAFRPTYIDTADGPKTVLYVGPATAIAMDVTRPHPDKGYPTIRTAIGRVTFFLNRGKAGGYITQKRERVLKNAMKDIRDLYRDGEMDRMARRRLEQKVPKKYREAIEAQQRLREEGEPRGRGRVAAGYLGTVYQGSPDWPTGATSFADGDYVGMRPMWGGGFADLEPMAAYEVPAAEIQRAYRHQPNPLRAFYIDLTGMGAVVQQAGPGMMIVEPTSVANADQIEMALRRMGIAYSADEGALPSMPSAAFGEMDVVMDRGPMPVYENDYIEELDLGPMPMPQGAGRRRPRRPRRRRY